MKVSHMNCNIRRAERRPGIKCRQCATPLRYTGAKLEVPKHNDFQGWKILEARLDNPLYRQTWISHPGGVDQKDQAKHWSRCRLQERHGCGKCNAIKTRVADDPDPQKLSWELQAHES